MLYIFIAIAIVAADQLVKLWSVSNLLGREPVEFIHGILNLRYVENTGAAFSILTGQRWLFIALTPVAVGVICYIIFAKKITNKVGLISLGMVLGGALGNFVDRLLRGYVVDMFEFAFIKFPVFNIADIFITCGGLLFIAYFVASEVSLARIEKRRKEADGGTESGDEA